MVSIRRAPQAAGRLLADLLGRLHRPALQRADADQPGDREEPDARLDRAGDRPARASWRRLRRRRGGGGAHDRIVGGEGDGSVRRRRRDPASRAPSSRSTTCSTSPRPTTSGRSTRTTAASSGTTSGRRAAARTSATAASAMWGNYLFFDTPDNYLVSLDARTGKERWHDEIASFSQQYFSTSAPMVDRQPRARRHRQRSRLAGLPAVVRSGDRQAAVEDFYTVPMNPGDPGLDTWTSLDAARHGGGQPWIPGAYDPETKLYIFGTGNPTPAYTGQRGEGRQPLHLRDRRRQRRHRQDGVVLPDLAARHPRLGLGADADAGRRRLSTARPRKLVLTASRNGYFFTLDRLTGEHMVTSTSSPTR